jgi:hypothetical protein
VGGSEVFVKVVLVLLLAIFCVTAAARIYELQLSPLVIVTANCPDGQVGVWYSCQLVGSGGAPPYTWSIGSGFLPEGLSLNSSTGLISGVPVSPFPPVDFRVISAQK